MTELEQRLRTIVTEKEERLLPENLKAGVTCLGVDGSFVGSPDDYLIKVQFDGEYDTIENTINNKKIDNFSITGQSIQREKATPDKVIAIEHPMGNIDVILMKENLLVNDFTTETKNGITATTNSDGSITLVGTATAQTVFTLTQSLHTNLKIGSTYVTYMGQTETTNLWLAVEEATTSYKRTLSNSTNPSWVWDGFQAEGDRVRVSIVIGAGVTLNTTITPAIAEGSLVRFPLENTHLPANSYLADDGIHITRDTMTLNGTETWYNNYANDEYYSCYLSVITYGRMYETCLSDRLGKCVFWNDYDVVGLKECFWCFGGSSWGFQIKKSRLSTVSVNGFKTWLSNNPINVEYNLPEENIIPYTEDQQIAWEKLKAMTTLGGINIITTTATSGIRPLLHGEVDINATIEHDCYDICNQLTQDILNTNYVQLEYIESHGAQFIETDFLVYQNTSTYRIEAEMQLVKFGESDDYAIIGTGNYYMGWRSGDYNKVTFAPDGKSVVTSIAVDYTTKHKFYIDAITKTFGYDDAVSSFTPGTKTDNDATATLFGWKQAQNPYSVICPHSMRIYYCKIWNNGILIRDYIPVRRVSDNEICMFDKVTHSIVLNGGSGDFIPGPEKI